MTPLPGLDSSAGALIQSDHILWRGLELNKLVAISACCLLLFAKSDLARPDSVKSISVCLIFARQLNITI